jgi:hypothetical protein
MGGAVGEQRAEPRLATILAADVAGYCRLMGANEIGMVSTVKSIEPKSPMATSCDGLILRLWSITGRFHAHPIEQVSMPAASGRRVADPLGAWQALRS